MVGRASGSSRSTRRRSTSARSATASGISDDEAASPRRRSRSTRCRACDRRVDDYGRLLRYVVRADDGVSINVRLVELGAAAPYFLGVVRRARTRTPESEVLRLGLAACLDAPITRGAGVGSRPALKRSRSGLRAVHLSKLLQPRRASAQATSTSSVVPPMASLAHARSLELREVLLSLRGVRLGSPPPTSTALGGGLPAQWDGGQAVLALCHGSLSRRGVGAHSEGEGPERWRHAVAERRQVDRLEGRPGWERARDRDLAAGSATPGLIGVGLALRKARGDLREVLESGVQMDELERVPARSGKSPTTVPSAVGASPLSERSLGRGVGDPDLAVEPSPSRSDEIRAYTPARITQGTYTHTRICERPLA